MRSIYKYLIVIGIIIVFSFASVKYVNYNNSKITGNVIKEEAVPEKVMASVQKPVITLDNFPSYLQGNEIVQNLPEGALISLKLSSGESYSLEKGKVQSGDVGDPDIVITIDSKYVSELGDFCSAIRNARNNGELKYELKKSKVSLLYKYKGLMKYKSCFGFE